ncbi:hypothetical protein RRG08_056542 [Elysia crispata]|uniref:Type-1 angiotensin II receptor-associated protein n=1 Tax=Elysia crispata TaxID=231223 RepID=A0AAE1BB32_9GAST|nr:hypothetical protein RRG08_056542 [Elysia crispata]
MHHQYEALSSEGHRFDHSGDHSFTQRTRNFLGRMDFEVPPWAPKVCWLLHFTLTSWVLLSPFIQVQTYIYSQLVFLGVGSWILLDRDRAEAALLFFFTILITIVNDIIVISIYTPRGYDTIEDVPSGNQEQRNSFRFALIMSIANLMFKPFTAFFMLKIYHDNSARSSSSSSSNTDGSRGNYGAHDSSRGYQNLEEDRPTREPDTQSEHQYVDLHDDPKDVPPHPPPRNNAQYGGSSQGSEASSYYSAKG